LFSVEESCIRDEKVEAVVVTRETNSTPFPILCQLLHDSSGFGCVADVLADTCKCLSNTKQYQVNREMTKLQNETWMIKVNSKGNKVICGQSVSIVVSGINFTRVEETMTIETPNNVTSTGKCLLIVLCFCFCLLKSYDVMY
jgi:hypothetical protein